MSAYDVWKTGEDYDDEPALTEDELREIDRDFDGDVAAYLDARRGDYAYDAFVDAEVEDE